MKSVFWKAAVLTAVIFFLGVGAAWVLEEQRVSSAKTELAELKIQADEARLEMLFFTTFKDSPNFCSLFDKEVGAAINRVGVLEAKLAALKEANKLDESYAALHKQHVLFNAELWLQTLNAKRACNSGVPSILYFYPENAYCVECARQAAELDSLKRECGEKVRIFAFPLNYLAVTDLIAENYGVGKETLLVLNEEIKTGLKTSGELKQLLDLAC